MSRTIDDVLHDLDEVVDVCRRERSRAGYFAALYRRVTAGVRDWIREGRFDDGPRMERLDVLFADRYLDAWRRWREGRETTRAWAMAFQSAGEWWPIVLQHLLLGMNAHINLDLGIATARTATADELPALEDDFLLINRLLAANVDHVQDRLSEVWPLFRVLDWVGGRKDESTLNFSIGKARREAWGFAHRLAARPEAEWAAEIRATDGLVTGVGGLVRRPGFLLGSAVRVIRMGELRSTEEVIDLLS